MNIHEYCAFRTELFHKYLTKHTISIDHVITNNTFYSSRVASVMIHNSFFLKYELLKNPERSVHIIRYFLLWGQKRELSSECSLWYQWFSAITTLKRAGLNPIVVIYIIFDQTYRYILELCSMFHITVSLVLQQGRFVRKPVMPHEHYNMEIPACIKSIRAWHLTGGIEAHSPIRGEIRSLLDSRTFVT